jgi:hypothetical protein
MRVRLLALAAALAAAGCARPAYQLAPVSGTVTLNGAPLAGAWVHFAPKAEKGKPAPGPTSHGQTDRDGRYTLHVKPGQPGAVVGTSRVFISRRAGGAAPGEPQPDAGGRKEKEQLPRRYNEETTLEYDVPAGGTDGANFELKSP